MTIINKPEEATLTNSLAELADRRREETRVDLERTATPSYILEIVQTEVSYVISPRCLPFEQANIQDFSNRLQTLYGLTRIDPDVQRFSDPIALLRDDTPESALAFKNGRFKISSQHFAAIKSLSMTYERIQLVLTGPSSVADTVVPDVIEQLWASAGVSKSWKDIEPYIQLKAYACATSVDLGFPLTRMLSKELTGFLNDHFISKERFAQEMAPKSAVDHFSTPDRLVAGYVVDDINLLFNVFDPQSGRANQLKLRFNVNVRNSYGSNQCTVVSELPYEKHLEAIRLLRKCFVET